MNDPSPVCKESNYEMLYNAHFKSVRNFIYYKSGNLELSEDMAQESFIKMWENCRDVLIEKARGFLFTVANNLFLNDVRHRNVQLSFNKQQLAQSPSGEQRPDFKIEEKEFKARLERAISDLPEGQREVFLMNRIDKMTFAEIAATLNLSIKAVEKRMGLCLKTLKEKVSELNTYKI